MKIEKHTRPILNQVALCRFKVSGEAQIRVLVLVERILARRSDFGAAAAFTRT
jgi:hypothetical protein